jgi:hypothetical protein
LDNPVLKGRTDRQRRQTQVLAAVATAIGVRAQTSPQAPYTARAFTPAHGDLARSGGVPAQLANEEYVEALARVVYYWGYPAVDVMTRTSQWETMKQGPGSVLGVFPGGHGGRLGAASPGLSFSVDTARPRQLPRWRHLGCMIDESSKRMP